jgi:hypothetical protein
MMEDSPRPGVSKSFLKRDNFSDFTGDIISVATTHRCKVKERENMAIF